MRITMNTYLQHLVFIWGSCIVCIVAGRLQISEERRAEVCTGEAFTATCGHNEIILMSGARYGHLYLGRCISRDLGHFGCETDVITLVDSRCSGKRSCTISLSDPALEKLEPECADGLRVFLDARYVCIRGMPAKDLCRTLEVTETMSYFLTSTVRKATCAQNYGESYIEMTAKEGQNIKLQILTVTIPNDASNDTSTSQYGYVVERGQEKQFTYARDSRGLTTGNYTSQSHTITLVLKEQDRNHIVTYQATGCLKITPPPNTWSERAGDTLTIKCYSSDQSWNLRCVGTKWTGVVGNCTMKEVKIPTEIPQVVLVDEDNEIQEEGELTKEVIVVIIAAATALLCTAVIIVGYACVRMAKRKQGDSQAFNRCEMVPMNDSMTRSRGPTDDQVGAWAQTLTSNPSLSRNKNNGAQMIIMDNDLITINGINHA